MNNNEFSRSLDAIFQLFMLMGFVSILVAIGFILRQQMVHTMKRTILFSLLLMVLVYFGKTLLDGKVDVKNEILKLEKSDDLISKTKIYNDLSDKEKIMVLDYYIDSTSQICGCNVSDKRKYINDYLLQKSVPIVNGSIEMVYKDIIYKKIVQN